MTGQVDLQAYHETGFVLVRGVFDAASMDELRRETDELLDRASHAGRALTVHGSYFNRSALPRRILLVQMRSPDNQPLTEQHRSPGQGTMLRGINPHALEI